LHELEFDGISSAEILVRNIWQFCPAFYWKIKNGIKIVLGGWLKIHYFANPLNKKKLVAYGFQLFLSKLTLSITCTL